jgi:hypothetical protein
MHSELISAYAQNMDAFAQSDFMTQKARIKNDGLFSRIILRPSRMRTLIPVSCGIPARLEHKLGTICDLRGLELVESSSST